MAEYTFTDQSNLVWGETFKMGKKAPAIANRIFGTLDDAFDFANDVSLKGTAVAGLILSVINDGDNNGLYRIASVATAENANDAELEKMGLAFEPLTASTYADALVLATESTLTRIIDVKNSTDAVTRTYQVATTEDGTESSLQVMKFEIVTTFPGVYGDCTVSFYDPESGSSLITTSYDATNKTFEYNGVTYSADDDSESKTVVVEDEKSAGLYVVNGIGSIAKLGTTTASSDLAGDIATLQGKVSTLEGKVSDIENDTTHVVDGDDIN